MVVNRRRFTKIAALAIGMVTNFSVFHRRILGDKLVNGLHKDVLRIGIIGTGSRGTWLAEIIGGIPDIKLMACCDLLESNLEKGLSLSDNDAIGYKDYRRLLENTDIDAVIIATPLSLHFQMSMDAINAGKHVYCEKTMTHNIEESIILREKVRLSDIVFQVGYQHRFNPLYEEIKFLIENGYCGKVAQINCTWNRNGNWRRPLPIDDFNASEYYPDIEHLVNWRMYNKYSAGLVGELSSHQIDFVNWILEDKPRKIIGFGGVNYWKDGRETYDNVATMFEYANGIKATFSSLTTNALLGYSIKILGNRGSIEIIGEQGHRAKIFAEKLELEESLDGISGATKIAWEANEGVPIRVKNPASDDMLPTENSIKHFSNCIRNVKVPKSNVDNGHVASVCVHLANLAILEDQVKYWEEKYN